MAKKETNVGVLPKRKPWQEPKFRYILYWIISMAIGFTLMIVILLQGIVSLAVTLVMLISGLKFIAAFGLLLSILEYALKFMERRTDYFKGVERIYKLKQFQWILISIPILLLLYKGPVKLYQNLTTSGSADNVFDKLLFLYGIAALELKIYIIPLYKDSFITNITKVEQNPPQKLGQRVKESFQQKIEEGRRKWLKFRKEIGKLHIEEQESIRDYLNEWKNRISLYMLPILGLGMLIFTPIALIFITFWLRAIFSPERKPYKFERYLLLLAHIATLIIALLIPFAFDQTTYYITIQNYYYIADIFGFLGLLWVSIMYIQQLRKSEFVKWMEQKQLEYEEKIAKKYLKKQQKQLKNAKN